MTCSPRSRSRRARLGDHHDQRGVPHDHRRARHVSRPSPPEHAARECLNTDFPPVLREQGERPGQAAVRKSTLTCRFFLGVDTGTSISLVERYRWKGSSVRPTVGLSGKFRGRQLLEKTYSVTHASPLDLGAVEAVASGAVGGFFIPAAFRGSFALFAGSFALSDWASPFLRRRTPPCPFGASGRAVAACPVPSA